MSTKLFALLAAAGLMVASANAIAADDMDKKKDASTEATSTDAAANTEATSTSTSTEATKK